MSVSQKSDEVYLVDIPEVTNAVATFRYSYYVSDEGVTEDTRVKPAIQNHDAADFESYLKYVSERSPRLVMISFSPTRIVDYSKSSIENWTSKFTFRPQLGGMISSNLDKIISEDNLSFNGFTAIQFHDGALSTKTKELVSASILQHLYVEDYADDISDYRKSLLLSSHTPNSISSVMLSKSVSSTSSAISNVTFQSLPNASGVSTLSTDDFFDDIESVDVHTQINNKVLNDLVEGAIASPMIPSSTDALSLHQESLSTQRNAIAQSRVKSLTKFNIPFIDVKKYDDSTNDSRATVVGYVIDKIEVLNNGGVRLCDPLIVENSMLGNVVDFNVRYGATYMYSVRTIAKTSITALDDDSDELLTATVLLSSNPSNRTYVVCEENCPPPPPTDLSFRWDYNFTREKQSDGNGRAFITWTFPPNSQRDIKKFQVFRRSSLDEPFLLIREYDFNDSLAPLPIRELPGPGVSEKLSSPRCWFYDDEFTKNSTFIYAVACIDAHELSSGYSDQFLLSFDVYQNRLMKKLISHSGAPKPYPNMYVEGDLFPDSIVDENHDKIRFYFNPEYFTYHGNDTVPKNAFATVQSGGDYRVQFINTSVQDSESLSISVNDKRPQLLVDRRLTSPQLSVERLTKVLKSGK